MPHVAPRGIERPSDVRSRGESQRHWHPHPRITLGYAGPDVPTGHGFEIWTVTAQMRLDGVLESETEAVTHIAPGSNRESQVLNLRLLRA